MALTRCVGGLPGLNFHRKFQGLIIHSIVDIAIVSMIFQRVYIEETMRMMMRNYESFEGDNYE